MKYTRPNKNNWNRYPMLVNYWRLKNMVFVYYLIKVVSSWHEEKKILLNMSLLKSNFEFTSGGLKGWIHSKFKQLSSNCKRVTGLNREFRYFFFLNSKYLCETVSIKNLSLIWPNSWYIWKRLFYRLLVVCLILKVHEKF